MTEDGQRVTYRELAERADAVAQTLGVVRRLVLVEVTNALEPLIAYLGALRGGHPVILAAAGGDHERLLETFQPDAHFRRQADGWQMTLAEYVADGLHPELALLLSTSGTTGATKLVRLSAGAVDANARSIGEYLGLTQAERAITSLPFHYSYGLSVVNSHLMAGATLLLTDRSVTDPEFWRLLEEGQATSIAGVPYTYELLERMGFRDRLPSSVRTLTQAGGRLPPETVAQIAAWAAGRGARFFVMYGQTEATARMAYLPPDRALAHPGAIGVAIPGGEFRLLDEQGRLIQDTDTVGELVYRGPNVMMGYGLSRDDLARDADITELQTGDLASRDSSGLYRIAGRKSRFAKIFGLRLSLDEVEAKIRALDGKGISVSDDQRLYIALTAGEPAHIAAALSEAYKLPPAVIQVSRLDDLPTLPSGKVDYQAVLRAGRAAAEAEPAAEDQRHPIESAFAHAFPRATVTAGASFVSLGGDSLNYVSLSIDLERRLGFLPQDWEHLTVAELSALAPRSRRLRWWSLRTIESEVVLRMFAILAVVVNHASDWIVGGGAEVLLILAGYNLARYQKPRLEAGQGFSFAFSFFRRIILPYYVLLTAYLLAKGELDAPSLLLVSNLFGRFGSLIEPFWFLEAMIQCLMIVAVISLAPPVQLAIRRNPWRFGLMCLAVTVVLKCATYAVLHHDHLMQRTPDAALLLLATGWCVHEARTVTQRLLMTGALAALAVLGGLGVPGLWPAYVETTGLSHAVWLAACAFALLWVRRLPLPMALHSVVGAIAAASFYIYLTHVVPLWVFYWHLGWKSLALNLLAAIGLGLSAYWVSGKLSDAWARRTGPA